MKKIVFILVTIFTITYEIGHAQENINKIDTLHIPIKIKEAKPRFDTTKQQPASNQITEIYTTDYIMPRVDLAAYASRSFILDFDHHDPNGQYTILAISLTNLSGNGSAEIMNSLTPVSNGYTTLWLHNPHPFERGQVMTMRFVVFFRKNY